MSNWNNWFVQQLAQLQDKQQLRFLAPAIDDNLKDGKMINLASNDYLGLLSSSTFIAGFSQSEFYQSNLLGGSAASRLLPGYHYQHLLLEQNVERLSGKATLLFNSGYHANLGIIDAIASNSNCLVLADRLVHASIIDGIKLSKAKFKRFAHNDYQHLTQLIEHAIIHYQLIIIVVESLYSMDGDFCDLDKLVELKRQYPQKILLYVDEAHSIGIYGEQGLGICDSNRYRQEVDIVVAPCGKALASQGCLVMTTELIKQFIINRCRLLIYSTAIPPYSVAWLNYVIKQLMGEQIIGLRQKLFDHCQYLKAGFYDLGLDFLGDSYILSVVYKSSELTQQKVRQLREQNIIVSLIRPPTVANNTSRIRLSLHANLQINDCIKLLNAVKKIK